MKTQSNFMDIVKSSYMVLIIAMLGIFAFISAVLIPGLLSLTSARSCLTRIRL